jgi:hypothetical protein
MVLALGGVNLTDAQHRGRVRGLSPRIETPIRRAQERKCASKRATFPHKGRSEEAARRTDKVKGLVLRTEVLKA